MLRTGRIRHAQPPAFEQGGETAGVGVVEQDHRLAAVVEVGRDGVHLGRGEERSGPGDDEGVAILRDRGRLREVDRADRGSVAGDLLGDGGGPGDVVVALGIVFAVAGDEVDGRVGRAEQVDDGGGAGAFPDEHGPAGLVRPRGVWRGLRDHVGLADDAEFRSAFDQDGVGLGGVAAKNLGGLHDVVVDVEGARADGKAVDEFGGFGVFEQELAHGAAEGVGLLEERGHRDLALAALEDAEGSLGEATGDAGVEMPFGVEQGGAKVGDGEDGGGEDDGEGDVDARAAPAAADVRRARGVTGCRGLGHVGIRRVVRRREPSRSRRVRLASGGRRSRRRRFQRHGRGSWRR